MTFELKENEYISEFVSGGPKNYPHKLLFCDVGSEGSV
jgi:hypothetical protein